jgi:hypothetical protein
MDPETRIAHHHLGDMFRRVDRQGSRYQVVCDDGAIDHPPTAATGATVAEAAADCAAQLRAAGWVPTHARLEWEPRPARTALSEDGNQEASANLRLHVGTIRPLLVLWIRQDQGDVWTWPGWDVRGKLPEVLKAVADYVAANLPYHLPPFPGDKP